MYNAHNTKLQVNVQYWEMAANGVDPVGEEPCFHCTADAVVVTAKLQHGMLVPTTIKVELAFNQTATFVLDDIDPTTEPGHSFLFYVTEESTTVNGKVYSLFLDTLV